MNRRTAGLHEAVDDFLVGVAGTEVNREGELRGVRRSHVSKLSAALNLVFLQIHTCTHKSNARSDDTTW